MITKTFSFGTVTVDFDADEITINMMITGEIVKTNIEDTNNRIKSQVIQAVVFDFIAFQKKVHKKTK